MKKLLILIFVLFISCNEEIKTSNIQEYQNAIIVATYIEGLFPVKYVFDIKTDSTFEQISVSRGMYRYYNKGDTIGVTINKIGNSYD